MSSDDRSPNVHQWAFFTPLKLAGHPDMKIEVDVDRFGRLLSLSPHINVTGLEARPRLLVQCLVERAALWVDALITGAYDKGGLAADVLADVPDDPQFDIERAMCRAVIAAEAEMASALKGDARHGDR